MFKELSNDQLDRLSDICSDIAMLSLASIVLPAFIDKSEITLMLSGIAGTAFFLALSLKLLNNKLKL